MKGKFSWLAQEDMIVYFKTFDVKSVYTLDVKKYGVGIGNQAR